MDLDYFMKLQNANGTNSRREKNLAMVNNEMSSHFYDTFSPESVLVNGRPMDMMIIKDTDGNTFKKKIKTKHNDVINLGEYVFWNGQYWLITLLDVDDKTWHRGYMYLCTVLLRWQSEDGNIKEAWAYSEDFTKYSKGTTGNETVHIADNQYGLTVGVNPFTKELYRGMRFAVDFDDSIHPDIYTLSNRKAALNNYEYFNRGGTMILTLSIDAFHEDIDKYVKLPDGKYGWICNYKDKNNENIEESVKDLIKITFNGKQELKVGGNYKTFTGHFMNGNIENTSIIGEWEIISIPEMEQYIKKVVNNNSIKIKITDNEFAVGNKIRLVFRNQENTLSNHIDINIVNLF